MNKLRDSANERDCKLKVAKFYSPKKQYYWLGIFTIVRRDMQTYACLNNLGGKRQGENK